MNVRTQLALFQWPRLSDRKEIMTNSTASAAPTFTITVGNAGTFTNDSSRDISKSLNAEIAAAPKGDTIVIDFEPGVYGAVGSIELPSNTTVQGNDATLAYLSNGKNKGAMFGLISNEDSQFYNGTLTVNNTSGPPTVINYATTTSTMAGDSATAILDSNISVKGMTFESTNNQVFSTWFINATNIDVQNNTYIGGQDGNAFVNVVNGVVANNIAVGQLNANYDNWDGPTNIAIADNSAYLANDPTGDSGGWSILLNACPSGDPNNPGNAMNDAIVNNNIANIWSGSAAIYASALTNVGVSSENNITEQGNAITALNAVNAGGFVSGGDMSNLTVQDNLVSGAVTEPINEYTPIDIAGDGTIAPTTNTNVEGNLVFGAYSSNGQAMISNAGSNPQSNNNAVLGASSQATGSVSNSAQGGSVTSNGNIIGIGNQIIGAATTENILLAAAPGISVFPDTMTSIAGLDVFDSTDAGSLSITLSSIFGTIDSSQPLSNANYSFVNGELELVITGNLATVQQELSTLYYQSNTMGWDDAINISASDSNGYSATRYIPVLVEGDQGQISQLTTITPGEYGTASSDILPAPAGAPSQITLSSDTVIASAGANSISMGTTTSVAFLGTGDSTVTGGANQEYIVGGSGRSLVNLANQGDVTVVGGTGGLTVNAQSGNNLVEAQSAAVSVSAGSGSNSVIGGLGNTTVQGGDGSLYLATLPESGGNLVANLGTGQATVLALSGNAILSSQQNSSNLIRLGAGSSSVLSSGNDTIYGGTGLDSIIATAASRATIDLSGSGNVLKNSGSCQVSLGGSNNLVEGFQSSQTNIQVTGANNTVLVAGGAETVTALGGSSGLSAVFNGCSGSLDFINQSSGAVTLSGAAAGATGGSATVLGGAGGGVFTGGPSGSNSLTGGSGLVSLFGAGNGNVLSASAAGAGSQANILSVGNSTGTCVMIANATTTNNIFYGGGTGDISISSSGSGVQSYYVGTHDCETISGSSASSAQNFYYFDQSAQSAGSQDEITNFNLSTDKIYIDANGPYQGDAAISTISPYSNSGSVITLSDNTVITLIGISPSQLSGLGVNAKSNVI